MPKKIWLYTSEDLKLENNKPFDTIKDASSYMGTSRSTVINILDKNIAMSKGMATPGHGGRSLIFDAPRAVLFY